MRKIIRLAARWLPFVRSLTPAILLATGLALGAAALAASPERTRSETLASVPPTWTEQLPARSPPARHDPALVFDSARTRILLFGGATVTSVLTDTWTWNGSNWFQRAPATSPEGRAAAMVAYDASTQTVVLFGGDEMPCNPICTPVNDTWLWDGTSWTKQSPPVSPPRRAGGRMAYDAATGTVLLFGGAELNVFLNDTWIWNGKTKTWTQVFPATSPAARYYPSMASDGARQKIVLFGGEAKNPTDTTLNDTWLWDGRTRTWTQQLPATSPPARTDASMAYDPVTHQVLLFAGDAEENSSEVLGDTWAWDGSSWTQLFPATSPPARWRASMVYDPVNAGLVLFGGATGLNHGLLDDTWIYR